MDIFGYIAKESTWKHLFWLYYIEPQNKYIATHRYIIVTFLYQKLRSPTHRPNCRQGGLTKIQIWMCNFCDLKASGTPLLPTSPALPPQAAFLRLAQLVCFPECIVHSCFWVFHMLILQTVSFLPVKTLLGLYFLPSKKYLSKMPFSMFLYPLTRTSFLAFILLYV